MGRKLKKQIFELLSCEDFPNSLEKIRMLPARQAVNPLFSFFYSTDELVKWHAITAMGAVVSSLADNEIESARVIMRRLMWNLNDESGGIGWGSPEAMGETMALNEKLAGEYSNILLSYINPGGNYLEHEILQQGVLWGLGRLAQKRPALLEGGASFLYRFMEKQDKNLRGLSVWVAGFIHDEAAKPYIENLIDDNSKIRIFENMNLVEYTVGQLAMKCLY